MKNITIFSLNIDNNIPSQQKNLHTICFNSWERMRKFFNDLDIQMNIKIYTKDDIEFINFYKDFTTRTPYTFDNLKISHIADAFRLYIMSMQPHYLWLDWDMFVLDNFRIEIFDYDNKIFRNSFNVLYNGNELEFFKKLYNYIIDNRLNNFGDKEITKILINDNIITKNDLYVYRFTSFRNLFYLKNRNSNDWIFMNILDRENIYYKELLRYANGETKIKLNKYVFITKNTQDVIAKNLGDDKTLINFILTNYNLSSEQVTILNSWLN